jgi:hypothetical protein
MGNEIFYCTECGARASGSDFAPGTSGFGADRSCCPACLGLPVVSRRESTKKLRKPSSTMNTAVAVRPRVAEAPPPKRSVAPLIGAALLAVAAAGAFVKFPSSPEPRASVVLPAPPPPVPPPAASLLRASERDELPRVLEDRREKALRPPPAEPLNPELEAQAEAAYVEIEEAATALADEGRVPDALAQIRRFPDAFRPTRAGANLERLRLRIEQRAR